VAGYAVFCFGGHCLGVLKMGWVGWLVGTVGFCAGRFEFGLVGWGGKSSDGGVGGDADCTEG
jgi:hypothetical protein